MSGREGKKIETALVGGLIKAVLVSKAMASSDRRDAVVVAAVAVVAAAAAVAASVGNNKPFATVVLVAGKLGIVVEILAAVGIVVAQLVLVAVVVLPAQCSGHTFHSLPGLLRSCCCSSFRSKSAGNSLFTSNCQSRFLFCVLL